MRTFILSFVLTAVLAALFTPVARRIAIRVGAVSTPGGRNINARHIPRLGGIAIAAAFASMCGILMVIDTGTTKMVHQNVHRVVGLLGGALIVFGVGVLDDTRRVRALHKLYAQVAAASLAYACGFRIEGVSLPFLGDLSMGIFALPVTIVWIVGVVNAINLIDGLDGLAGGIVFFAGITNFVVARGSDLLVATVMATMLGAVLGFLFFNFNPARIFMGDSGSYFLGFVLGASTIGGEKSSTTVAILVPMIALGVPIFDTMLTMVRRFLEKKPLFSPDRGHIHHRLLDMGFTQRRAVLTLYGVTIVFTVAAIAMSFGRSWHVGVALVLASIVAIGLYRSVGYFDYLVRLNQRKERVRAFETEVLRRAVPRALETLREVKSEAQALEVLEEIITTAGLAQGELRNAEDAPIREWSTGPEVARDELVSARFPVGTDARARTTMVFRWRGYEVNPQTEILLQVAVDALAEALARAESVLGPQPRTTTPNPAVSGGEEQAEPAVASSRISASA
jgi:UDP-GlcNAc:undecaprenyl-phosphate GlcNAc-1-phosphate transferase